MDVVATLNEFWANKLAQAAQENLMLRIELEKEKARNGQAEETDNSGS